MLISHYYLESPMKPSWILELWNGIEIRSSVTETDYSSLAGISIFNIPMIIKINETRNTEYTSRPLYLLNTVL